MKTMFSKMLCLMLAVVLAVSFAGVGTVLATGTGGTYAVTLDSGNVSITANANGTVKVTSAAGTKDINPATTITISNAKQVAGRQIIVNTSPAIPVYVVLNNATSSLVMTGGALNVTTGATTLAGISGAGAVYMNGSGLLTVNGNVTAPLTVNAGAVTVTGTLSTATVAGTGALTAANVGNVTKSGAGNATVTGNVTGTATVNGGTLTVNGTTATAAVNGGTLTANAVTNATVGGGTLTANTVTGLTVSGAGSATVKSNVTNATVNGGKLTANGGVTTLTVSGAGNASVAGNITTANVNGGAATVGGTIGTARVGGGTLRANGAVSGVVLTSGTLDYASLSVPLRSVSMTGGELRVNNIGLIPSGAVITGGNLQLATLLQAKVSDVAASYTIKKPVGTLVGNLGLKTSAKATLQNGQTLFGKNTVELYIEWNGDYNASKTSRQTLTGTVKVISPYGGTVQLSGTTTTKAYITLTKSSGGGGGSSTPDPDYEFWMNVLDEIEGASTGSTKTVYADATKYDDMPTSILEALKGTKMTLIIERSGKKDIKIYGSNMKAIPASQIFYRLDDLAKLYANSTSSSEADKPLPKPTPGDIPASSTAPAPVRPSSSYAPPPVSSSSSSSSSEEESTSSEEESTSSEEEESSSEEESEPDVPVNKEEKPEKSPISPVAIVAIVAAVVALIAGVVSYIVIRRRDM